jgi:ubiquinone/menaquinone biosynthesis C-methylase UbiE
MPRARRPPRFASPRAGKRTVDYERAAPSYDERYRAGEPPGIAAALRDVTQGARRVLEVGCGTGHWLAPLSAAGGTAFGLDRSAGMLARVAPAHTGRLVRGDACTLPLRSGSLDAIACVNALHHFGSGSDFAGEARRVLAAGGRVAVIGMDPLGGRDRWYLYDHFPGTLAADERRYPSADTIAAWLEDAGFTDVTCGVAARIAAVARNREVYADPILSRHGTSQLALLDDAAFAAGMQRIEDAIAGAERDGRTIEFVTDISLALVRAVVPAAHAAAGG